MSTPPNPVDELDNLRMLGSLITQASVMWFSYTDSVAQAQAYAEMIPSAQAQLLATQPALKAAENALHAALSVQGVPDLEAVFAASTALTEVFGDVRPKYDVLSGLETVVADSEANAAAMAAEIETRLPEIKAAIVAAYVYIGAPELPSVERKTR